MGISLVALKTKSATTQEKIADIMLLIIMSFFNDYSLFLFPHKPFLTVINIAVMLPISNIIASPRMYL